MQRISTFTPRVFCKCGWSKYAPHGEAFHAANGCPVCPVCGTFVELMKVKTTRLFQKRKHIWNEWEYSWKDENDTLISTIKGRYDD